MPWMQNLRALVVVLGWVAALWGVGYAVNGMTQAPAFVRVPVTVLADPDRSGWGNVPVEVPGVAVGADGDEPNGWFAGARPGGWSTTVGGMASGPDGTLTLVSWGSTRLEQLLARGAFLVGGLGALVGALALAPVLGSIADGRPFEPGNARRLVVLATAVGVAGAVAPMLPQLAGVLVLRRTGLAGPRFASAAFPDLTTPVLAALLVLAVAAAFRAGERLADDARGLV